MRSDLARTNANPRINDQIARSQFIIQESNIRATNRLILNPKITIEADSEERGMRYHNPADIPISKGGEVEDEAIDRSHQPNIEEASEHAEHSAKKEKAESKTAE